LKGGEQNGKEEKSGKEKESRQEEKENLKEEKEKINWINFLFAIENKDAPSRASLRFQILISATLHFPEKSLKNFIFEPGRYIFENRAISGFCSGDISIKHVACNI
jgi:hypothetical protein